MRANIEGEDKNGCGIEVTDNNGVKHWVEIKYENEKISYHEQDGYPDHPSDRTEAGNIHVNQARRFAKYWVYRKRGYETLAPTKNPDRITAVAVALTPLTSDAAETYLGDFYQHFQSLSGNVDSPIEMPTDVSPHDVVYQKDIYLGLEDETLGALAANILADPDVMDLLGKSLTVDGTTPPEAEYVPTFEEVIAEAADRDLESVSSLSDGALIDSVSDIHVHWDDPPGQYHTQWGDQPAVDREPDARIEIFPFDPDSVIELKAQIARHLLCQVRDCYLVMGIAPPEPFRLLGYGRHKVTGWYNNHDFYEEYFDHTTKVDTWYEEHTPENAYGPGGEPTAVQTD